MVRKPQDVTDAELAIMKVLWEVGPSTIREITDVVYPSGTASDYATVKKLLSRIEAKELVSRDASRMTHVFTATLTQDDFLDRRLQDVATDLCEGAFTPLVTSLLKNRKYSAKERKRLRELFDEMFGSDPRK